MGTKSDSCAWGIEFLLHLSDRVIQLSSESGLGLRADLALDFFSCQYKMRGESCKPQAS